MLISRVAVNLTATVGSNCCSYCTAMQLRTNLFWITVNFPLIVVKQLLCDSFLFFSYFLSANFELYFVWRDRAINWLASACDVCAVCVCVACSIAIIHTQEMLSACAKRAANTIKHMCLSAHIRCRFDTFRNTNFLLLTHCWYNRQHILNKTTTTTLYKLIHVCYIFLIVIADNA